jgi:hypothetical protein
VPSLFAFRDYFSHQISQFFTANRFTNTFFEARKTQAEVWTASWGGLGGSEILFAELRAPDLLRLRGRGVTFGFVHQSPRSIEVRNAQVQFDAAIKIGERRIEVFEVDIDYPRFRKESTEDGTIVTNPAGNPTC